MSVAAESVALAEPADAPTGYWSLIWRRFRRDRLAVTGTAAVLLLLAAVIVGGPLANRILGTGPNDLHPYAVSEGLKPVGPWTRVPSATSYAADGEPPAASETVLLVLGGDGQLGRDELQRLLYGGRISILVAVGATLLALAIGVVLGGSAALFGGLVDAVVSRVTDFVMSIPLLLFILFVGATYGDRLNDVTLGFLNQGVLALIVLIGGFTWFYPARLVRASVLELRQREFVEAARMIGASDARIVRTHLLPHLLPQLIVYGTLLVATNITLEAGLDIPRRGDRAANGELGAASRTDVGDRAKPDGLQPHADAGAADPVAEHRDLRDRAVSAPRR